jgi:serine/threonine protein kinase HipA of HipAB toxin-antitoxin module
MVLTRRLSRTVKLHVCRLVAMTFDEGHADLLTEADSIMDPAVLLHEVARRANHCRYF